MNFKNNKIGFEDALTMMLAEQGMLLDIIVEILSESGLTNKDEIVKLLKERAENFSKLMQEKQKQMKSEQEKMLKDLMLEIALNSEPKGEA